MPKYLNPYTDFGFKKLFGEEASKDLLIDFLNTVLPAHHQIVSLTFKNNEQNSAESDERKAFFDIFCTAESGEHFIVEMQKSKIKYFKDRALFYTHFPIREQAQAGANWNFELSPIYFVGILDFKYEEDLPQKVKFYRDVSLKDQDGDVFYDKLGMKFLQMPLFTKQAHELETRFDKWCYFLKNLESFDEIPNILNEPIFQKAFFKAELHKMSMEEQIAYEKTRLDYLASKAAIDTAVEDGELRGEIRGEIKGELNAKTAGVLRALQKGKLSIAEIIESFDVDMNFIEDVKRKFQNIR